jgi:hypothetical protein
MSKAFLVTGGEIRGNPDPNLCKQKTPAGDIPVVVPNQQHVKTEKFEQVTQKVFVAGDPVIKQDSITSASESITTPFPTLPIEQDQKSILSGQVDKGVKVKDPGVTNVYMEGKLPVGVGA